MEVDLLLPDGRPMPALLSAVRVELDGQDCVVTMIRDITESKRNERELLAAREELWRQVKALSASEETFRKLFDANLDSMTLTGPDGNYINVNREFVKGTGFSREDAIGHHFTELNMWIHPDEMIAFSEQLIGTNEVRNLEVAFRMKDGSEHPVLLSAVNLVLQGQVCCLTISREISDLKTTQRELVAAREAALAASRAKSEFLSSMSHEIRTPMNAILGMADLLAETELGDEQRRYLSTVISNSHALLELINSILDLAKVESGRISLEAVEFDLKDATEKVLEMLAIRAHEKGLELMVRFGPEVPELVLGDPLRLSQILINLVGNAIKFTQHGQVLVSVEQDTAGALEVHGDRYWNRNSRRQASPVVRRVQPSRFFDLAQIRRQRARTRNRHAAGGADARQGRGYERTRNRERIFIHGGVRDGSSHIGIGVAAEGIRRRKNPAGRR